MRAMVLAAGLGTRLRPLTNEITKPMVPVLDRPVMAHILDLLEHHGFEDVIANRYGCSLAGVECMPKPIAIGTYVVGIRKGDEALQAAIDAALDDMRASGELHTILSKAKLWNARQEGPAPDDGGKLKKRAFDASASTKRAENSGPTS